MQPAHLCSRCCYACHWLWSCGNIVHTFVLRFPVLRKLLEVFISHPLSLYVLNSAGLVSHLTFLSFLLLMIRQSWSDFSLMWLLKSYVSIERSIISTSMVALATVSCNFEPSMSICDGIQMKQIEEDFQIIEAPILYRNYLKKKTIYSRKPKRIRTMLFKHTIYARFRQTSKRISLFLKVKPFIWNYQVNTIFNIVLLMSSITK